MTSAAPRSSPIQTARGPRPRGRRAGSAGGACARRTAPRRRRGGSLEGAGPRRARTVAMEFLGFRMIEGVSAAASRRDRGAAGGGERNQRSPLEEKKKKKIKKARGGRRGPKEEEETNRASSLSCFFFVFSLLLPRNWPPHFTLTSHITTSKAFPEASSCEASSQVHSGESPDADFRNDGRAGPSCSSFWGTISMPIPRTWR